LIQTKASSLPQVEVDVLTGAFTPVRTDILFDAGKSLNPAVDIGQVRGFTFFS
jgi:xanthine dehydrogenase molybdopterin-binding subunit B